MRNSMSRIATVPYSRLEAVATLMGLALATGSLLAAKAFLQL